jgi:Piwi domain
MHGMYRKRHPERCSYLQHIQILPDQRSASRQEWQHSSWHCRRQRGHSSVSFTSNSPLKAHIYSRFDFDFYLQAHAGIQGHVKSTHYTVVYDENQLKADEIQKGTHDASHLYARATKAVSLIPAAYYADLACERGRCYLNGFLNDDKASASGRGRADKAAEQARVFNAAREAWGQGVSLSLLILPDRFIYCDSSVASRYEGDHVLHLKQ